MRSDMAKVIVERPRFGSRMRGRSKGSHRAEQRLSRDELPAREGMNKRHLHRTKVLNEHLGPLRRYLNSQVGRPWDKVFSEICAHINRNSAVQDHVRDHVEGYVAVHVVLIDDVPCWGGPGWGYGQALSERFWIRWYVCPRTGLLKRVQHSPRRRQPIVQEPPVFITLGKKLQCRRIDGKWHLVTLKPLPIMHWECEDTDVLLRRPVKHLTVEQLRHQYGAACYAVAVRPLSKKELRDYPVPRDAWK
jgi:hypothetical protein